MTEQIHLPPAGAVTNHCGMNKPDTSPATDRPRAALAVCAFEVKPGAASIRVFPAGEFTAPRGAMAGTGPWFMDEHLAGKLTARAVARGLSIPVDYEHQSLLAETNGQPAPAAGWINERMLAWIPDEPGAQNPGLHAAVTWTPRAKAMIDAGEYRYLSPVFEYDPETGAVLDLLSVALTNTPAMDQPLYAALTARHSSHPQETPVNETLKKFLAALGLPDATAEADALAAVAALKTQAADASTQIAALKAAPPDPAKYVPVGVVTNLQNEVAALKTSHEKAQVDALFKAAREAGKVISPEYEAHLRTIPVAALKGVLDGLTAVAALSGMQSDGLDPGKDGKPAVSAADQSVMQALGLTADEYAKGKRS
ncbi:MAG: phage protease [Candidatus Accumulibacter sp.]|nr:phage protease [Accumulibacter sp.]